MKEIDPRKVKQLAGAGLTVDEIAAVLDVSARTLQRRCVTPLKEGRTRLNGSLKRKQYIVAMKGNVAMLIWLGKQYLGQRDTVQVEAGPELVRQLTIPDVDDRYEAKGPG